MQTAYTGKLRDATREAIQAYEINSVIWETTFSREAGARRRHVTATVNAFLDGLARRMEVSGMSRRAMETFVPAVAFVGYDGVFIYTPTFVPNQERINDISHRIRNLPPDIDMNERVEYIEGVPTTIPGINDLLEDREFRHVLRPMMRYSARYTRGGLDVTVNYTLDNFVSVYGRLTSTAPWFSKEGYLIDKTVSQNISQGNVTINHSTFPQPITIGSELLEERIAFLPNIGIGPASEDVFSYVYNRRGQKIYFDTSRSWDDGRVFRLTPNDTIFRLNTVIIPEEIPADGRVQVPAWVEFSRFSRTGADPIYRLLNPGTHQGQWFEIVNEYGGIVTIRHITSGFPNRYNGFYPENSPQSWVDYSAVNYYIESAAFTNWVTTNLGGALGIRVSDKVNEGRDQHPDFIGNNALIFGSANNVFTPGLQGYENSVFTTHKRQIIRRTIEDNLNQAIANYAHHAWNFVMPQLTVEEWELVQSNISIITFLQGVSIGTRHFNNYAIATSTRNTEFVNNREMFFRRNGDEYYHRKNCAQVNDASGLRGHRSVDFMVRRAEWRDDSTVTRI